MKTIPRTATILTLAVLLLGTTVLIGCGGSDTPTPTQTISTDAVANKAVLTDFIGPNSVTVSGTWTNTYYGSTGGVIANATMDAATNVVTVNFDISGNVYGGSDPAPETFVLDMNDFIANGTAVLHFNSAVYGDVSATLTFYTDGTGIFTGSATNVPNPAVTDSSFVGTFQVSGTAVTFTITSARFNYGGIPIVCTSNLTTTIN